MHEYIIEGGFPIHGTITASGNKNAALPCIAATLLSAEPVILHNIPEIEDTSVMLNILQSFGVKITNIKKHSWKIEAKTVNPECIPKELSKKFVGLYDTYKIEGLPPGPICNPGMDAIMAALNPAKTDYYYYCHSADGTAYYAKTSEAHVSNLKKAGLA